VSIHEACLAIELKAKTVFAFVQALISAFGACFAPSAAVMTHELFNVMLVVMIGPIGEQWHRVRLPVDPFDKAVVRQFYRIVRKLRIDIVVDRDRGVV
jgi:hypothetical protein